MYTHTPDRARGSGGRPTVAHAGRAHEATEPSKPGWEYRAGPQKRTSRSTSRLACACTLARAQTIERLRTTAACSEERTRVFRTQEGV